MKFRLRPLKLIYSVSFFALFYVYSLLLSDMYVGGDQVHYTTVYENISSKSFFEGFVYYTAMLNSRELVHFIYIYIMSLLSIEKSVALSIVNSTLAYCLYKTLVKAGGHATVAFFIVLTGFYFNVLFFSAERLKFAVFFLCLAFLSTDKSKRSIFYALMSVLSHAQITIVYASILFSGFFLQVKKVVLNNRISIRFLLLVLAFTIGILAIREQIFIKLINYYSNSDVTIIDVITTFILFSFSYIYSKFDRSVIPVFTIMFLALILVGSSRMNMIIYFAFLYYSIPYRKGFNLGIILTSLYFSVKGLFFVMNIIDFGNGFGNY